MDNTVQPVQILTVAEKTVMYKKLEIANVIEKINLEEVGFDLVSQKDLYEIGEKVVYIQPDYCLSDISLFESYLKPDGDTKKSKLGSNNRIRAVKFNLHIGNNEPTYSNGIILPLKEVADYLKCNEEKLYELDLTKELNITKWEALDSGGLRNGKSGRQMPENIYKTDENNIHNCWSSFKFPLHLIGTEKIDGSSITLGVVNKEPFIASRKLTKPIWVEKIVDRRKPTIFERIKKFFSIYVDLNLKEVVINKSDFVKYGYPYVQKLMEKGYENILFRGELNGSHLKVSGNKNNPARKENPNIKFFDLNFPDQNNIYKKTENSVFETFCQDLKFNTCNKVFDKIINTKQELIDECDTYFKENKIEGIVVRTTDNKISAKYMNPEYDSKK